MPHPFMTSFYVETSGSREREKSKCHIILCRDLWVRAKREVKVSHPFTVQVHYDIILVVYRSGRPMEDCCICMTQVAKLAVTLGK